LAAKARVSGKRKRERRIRRRGRGRGREKEIALSKKDNHKSEVTLTTKGNQPCLGSCSEP